MKMKWNHGILATGLIVGILALGWLGCGSQNAESSKTAAVETASETETAGPIKVVSLKVEGMTCNSCEIALKKSLTKLDGVKEVEASYKEAKAVVKVDPEKVAEEQIVEAITKLGYTAQVTPQN